MTRKKTKKKAKSKSNSNLKSKQSQSESEQSIETEINDANVDNKSNIDQSEYDLELPELVDVPDAPPSQQLFSQRTLLDIKQNQSVRDINESPQNIQVKSDASPRSASTSKKSSSKYRFYYKEPSSPAESDAQETPQDQEQNSLATDVGHAVKIRVSYDIDQVLETNSIAPHKIVNVRMWSVFLKQVLPLIVKWKCQRIQDNGYQAGLVLLQLMLNIKRESFYYERVLMQLSKSDLRDVDLSNAFGTEAFKVRFIKEFFLHYKHLATKRFTFSCNYYEIDECTEFLPYLYTVQLILKTNPSIGRAEHQTEYPEDLFDKIISKYESDCKQVAASKKPYYFYMLFCAAHNLYGNEYPPVWNNPYIIIQKLQNGKIADQNVLKAICWSMLRPFGHYECRQAGVDDSELVGVYLQDFMDLFWDGVSINLEKVSNKYTIAKAVQDSIQSLIPAYKDWIIQTSKSDSDSGSDLQVEIQNE
ncbi:hypothetical protein MIR68_005931 [Amoeboaphelidium protococcarum]|nr:hypothetical protein MIR68_005931 [Amoeboaphelidium protococcarum]